MTDKGVPAALVMARTHSILRAEASRSDSPSEILGRANALLVPEMPARMFVTCLFAILDPATGEIVLANAGHNLPYVRTSDGVIELRATGMPLGLLPDIQYQETKGDRRPRRQRPAVLGRAGRSPRSRPGRCTASRASREEMAVDDAGSELLDRLLETLHAFTGPDWEQEDDITLVTLRRASGVADAPSGGSTLLTQFAVPGEEGNERLVMDRVAAAVADLGLDPARLERLKTAVSEAAMNAIEYGSQGRPGDPGRDRGGDDRPGDRRPHHGPGACPVRCPSDAEAPDIDAKLAGLQKPRGWGLFLIRAMVDDMDVTTDGTTQTVSLTLVREERA